MKTFIRKSETFSAIYNSIIIFISFYAAIILTVFLAENDAKAKLNDVKVNKIYELENTYKDDYTKALELSEVSIEKGESIIVKIETKSYKLSSTFDANGNYISTKTEAKTSVSNVIAVILFGIMIGFVAYVILYVPGALINKGLKKKDDILEEEYNRKKEEERKKEIDKEIKEWKKQFPTLYPEDEENENKEVKED